MPLFNRLLGLIVGLVLIGAGCVVACYSAGWIAPASLSTGPLVLQFLTDLQDDPGVRAYGPSIGGATAVLGVLLLFMETRVRRAPKDLLLRADSVGDVTVSALGLRRLADHVTRDLEGVEDVQSDAVVHKDGITFRCRVAVAPEVSTPVLAEEVRSRLSEAVKNHVGQEPAHIHIHTSIQSLNGAKRRIR